MTEEKLMMEFLAEANEIHDQLDLMIVDLQDLNGKIDSSAVQECMAYVILAKVAINKEL